MLGICMRHPSGERQTERREMENGEERDGAAPALIRGLQRQEENGDSGITHRRDRWELSSDK